MDALRRQIELHRQAVLRVAGKELVPAGKVVVGPVLGMLGSRGVADRWSCSAVYSDQVNSATRYAPNCGEIRIHRSWSGMHRRDVMVGTHRVACQVTRTESRGVGTTGRTNPRELRRISRRRKQRDSRNARSHVRKEQDKESKHSLTPADLVRYVAKSSSHHLSQSEIDNRYSGQFYNREFENRHCTSPLTRSESKEDSTS